MVGTQADDINSVNHANLQGPFTGLQLRCNNYQAVRSDIVVASGSINLFQGVDYNGNAIPAGNTFSHNCTPGSANDIFSVASMYYFYDFPPLNLPTDPSCFSQPLVTKWPMPMPVSCPSPYSGWSVGQLQALMATNFLLASNLIVKVSGSPFVYTPGTVSLLAQTN